MAGRIQHAGPLAWTLPASFRPPFVVEQGMRRFASLLSEKDRRRYAAVEAIKLPHGGTAYIVKLLDISPTTVQAGQEELDQDRDPAPGRVRGGMICLISRPEIVGKFNRLERPTPIPRLLIYARLRPSVLPPL